MGWFSGITNAVSGLFGGGDTGSLAAASVLNPSMMLGATTTIGNSIYNAYANKKAAKQQLEYQKYLMEYQNDWNLKQWNRENKYNSPSEIMQRYTEAGLNPNLIYGNSYSSASHLESAGGNAPQVKPANVNLMDALAFYNLEAQNQLLEAQNKLTTQNGYLSQANTQIASYRASEANARAAIALMNADYAEAEHKIWEKTGKIPLSYYKPTWDAELVSAIKGAVSRPLE